LKRLAAEQSLRNVFERIPIVRENLLRWVVGVLDNRTHLFVDFCRGHLAVVLFFLREVAAEKDGLLTNAERHGTQSVTHSESAYHAAGDLCCPLEVVAGAR